MFIVLTARILVVDGKHFFLFESFLYYFLTILFPAFISGHMYFLIYHERNVTSIIPLIWFYSEIAFYSKYWVLAFSIGTVPSLFYYEICFKTFS